jgi:hypothetical protein
MNIHIQPNHRNNGLYCCSPVDSRVVNSYLTNPLLIGGPPGFSHKPSATNPIYKHTPYTHPITPTHIHIHKPSHFIIQPSSRIQAPSFK